MTWIHCYNFYSGIGDFLRSSYSYFVYCKNNDKNYGIVFSNSNLKNCFYDNVINNDGLSSSLTNVHLVNDLCLLTP